MSDSLWNSHPDFCSPLLLRITHRKSVGDKAKEWGMEFDLNASFRHTPSFAGGWAYLQTFGFHVILTSSDGPSHDN